MTQQQTPKIASLKPIVYPDKRRVMLEMVVEHLPTIFSNVAFTMPDMPAQPPPKPEANAPSPYPNLELSILNSQGHEVAALFIVEHKEELTALTLHLRAPDADEQYTARATMTYQNQVLDVVETPFTLNQAD